MADVESQILARELGKIGGIGARVVARFLATVGHTNVFGVNASAFAVKKRVEGFLTEFGRPLQEFPSDPKRGAYSAIVGSGRLNLNPTIVHVTVNETDGMVSVSVRAFAKEGMVKQRTAEKLTERIERFLLGQTD